MQAIIWLKIPIKTCTGEVFCLVADVDFRKRIKLSSGVMEYDASAVLFHENADTHAWVVKDSDGNWLGGVSDIRVAK